MVDLGILSRLGLGYGNSPGYPILLHRLFFFSQLPQNSESEGEGGRAPENPLS